MIARIAVKDHCDPDVVTFSLLITGDAEIHVERKFIVAHGLDAAALLEGTRPIVRAFASHLLALSDSLQASDVATDLLANLCGAGIPWNYESGQPATEEAK